MKTILTHSTLSSHQARQQTINLLNEVDIPATEKRIAHYPQQFLGGMHQRVVMSCGGGKPDGSLKSDCC